jgi:hypothetical protein
VVLGARGARGKRKRRGMGRLEPKRLTATKKERGEGVGASICHGSGGMSFDRSSGTRGEGRGKRGEARRREARAALELGAMRGGEVQQEVAPGRS